MTLESKTVVSETVKGLGEIALLHIARTKNNVQQLSAQRAKLFTTLER